ncbi:hypothetical protein [Clostridium baratii]|uniref:Uncharacterized protein n=1 Tax=Clostridium baratii TaxID=1561 RepID=A0A174QP27_9CLOT|nr:hypothetical protein [Clostridium baratii]CUP75023.1 Uncharacterised protein [Clostridium baratii]
MENVNVNMNEGILKMFLISCRDGVYVNNKPMESFKAKERVNFLDVVEVKDLDENKLVATYTNNKKDIFERIDAKLTSLDLEVFLLDAKEVDCLIINNNIEDIKSVEEVREMIEWDEIGLLKYLDEAETVLKIFYHSGDTLTLELM